MRAWNKEPADQLRERYLGELAPLLAAARQVEELSPVAKKQVRKRIVRTLFGTKTIMGLRGRLVPVLVAFALLVFGGVAFATAQHLGLLPRLGGPAEEAPEPPASSQLRKRKGARGRAGARVVAGDEPVTAVTAELPLAASPPSPTPVLPALPEPPRAPAAAPTVTVASPEQTAASAATAPRSTTAWGAVRKGGDRPGRTLAMSAPPPTPAVGPAAPVMAAPAVPVAPIPSVSPTLVPAPATPHPAAPSAVPPTAHLPPSAPAVPPPVPAVAAPAAAAPAPAPAVGRPVSPDQALFGQAMRKLRGENDPAGALLALQEHAKAFPRSAFAGERLALEVEALLALHRERDALALLDVMALEELPRSGERLVLRGELRAAAQRWREASADFERALSRVSGSPSWHERALWGRGVSRLRAGDRAGGLADIQRYRELYPRGRFAGEAVKFLADR